LFAHHRLEGKVDSMDAVQITVLVCALCAAGIGAVYFVWTRKNSQPSVK
jgi:hypothetical protein